ncbi:MAG: DUF4365 domain-containing protein [Kofleriaceae bacterium]|nr:DUF4365 domain-containing protein [Kofleriaceae bacterium]
MADEQSELSIAYVRAVASAAGFFVQESSRLMDGDKIDLTIFRRGAGQTVRSPRLDVQVKSYASEPLTDAELAYDLDVDAYDRLIDTSAQVPSVLVVVVVPKSREEWLSHSEDQLSVRRCGYWLSLAGREPTANTATIRVRLPRTQVLDVTALRDMMARIGNKEPL